MRFSFAAVLGAFASMLTGCSFPADGITIDKAGLSSTRPESTIGAERSNAPWQTFSVGVPTGLAKAVIRTNSTFHLVVTDCRPSAGEVGADGRINLDGWIGAEDVYVDGNTLNLGRLKFRANRDRVFRGVAYVPAAQIKDVRELCFQAVGGSMLGFGFKSNIVRLRS
jgi:hypothetical protein